MALRNFPVCRQKEVARAQRQSEPSQRISIDHMVTETGDPEEPHGLVSRVSSRTGSGSRRGFRSSGEQQGQSRAAPGRKSKSLRSHLSFRNPRQTLANRRPTNPG